MAVIREMDEAIKCTAVVILALSNDPCIDLKAKWTVQLEQ